MLRIVSFLTTIAAALVIITAPAAVPGSAVVVFLVSLIVFVYKVVLC